MRWSRLRLVVPLLALIIAAGQAGADKAPACQEAMKAYQAALADWKAGHQQDAIAGFLKAAELAPTWGAPNARLGVIYQLQKREQDARQQYALTQAASLSATPPDSGSDARLRDLIITCEAVTIYLLNQSRLDNGLPVIVPDPTLNLVARRHSDEMRDKNYFSHESPTPGLTSCQDRFRAVFGYRPRLIGENIARRWGTLFCLSEERIAGSHTDLMNSPGHRHNILLDSIEWLGVGISANANGDYWLTEVFVEPGR